MARIDTQAVPPEKAGDTRFPQSGTVVRLSVGPARPIAEPPAQNQTIFPFIAPIPTQDELKAKTDSLLKAVYAKIDAGNPGPGKPKWVKDILRDRNEVLAEQEIKASLSTAKASRTPKPKGKDRRQTSLAFEANTSHAAQARNDLESEPVEVVPRAKLSLRDEILGMELPLFAVSKIPEVWQEPRTFTRKNGGSVTVSSSCYGAATIFDNDLPIYCASYINDLLERGQPISRRLAIETADFLRKTGRGDGRNQYEGIVGMLDRLAGTRLKTDIPTFGIRQMDSFGIIEGYEIILEKKRPGIRKNRMTGQEEPCEIVRVLKIVVTLSEWFYNSIRDQHGILSVDPAYFSLDSGIERRLYQIARRHCGIKKMLWKIDIELLAKKVSTKRELRKFREDIRHAIRDDRLPGYHIALDSQAWPNRVVFYQKEKIDPNASQEEQDKAHAAYNKALTEALAELSDQGPEGFNAFDWFYHRLERKDSAAIQAKPASDERKRRKKQRAAEREAATSVEDHPDEADGPGEGDA